MTDTVTDQNMTAQANMQDGEHRTSARNRTYIGATIEVDKHSTFSCVIKTRSENGFGLKLGATTGVPDQFWLHDEKTDERHFCEVVWRKRGGLGVKIIKPAG